MLEDYQPTWVSEEHILLGDSARRFTAQHIAPNDARWRRQHRVDLDTWRLAGSLGLLLADVPEAYGGMGGDFGHEAAIYRELARATEFGFTGGRAVHAIAAHYILHCGTEEQKHAWLPRMAIGEAVGAIAMTEPGAGSDLKSVRTRAEVRGDKLVIAGAKTYISNALNMGVLIVVAKTDPAAGSKGMSLILVDPRTTPGVTVSRVLDKVGMPSQDTCELFFDNCEVPLENILGGLAGRGMYQLMGQLPYERAILGLIAAGWSEQALAMTVAYTRERHAFGNSLFELQNTRFRLADIATQVMVGRVFTDFIVARQIAGTLDSATASMAKLWSSETLGEIVDQCVQLFGGAGYMNEYPIARLYADARVMRIFGGASEIMRELIARDLK